MEEKTRHEIQCGLRLGLDIAKLLLKAAGVAAAYCLVHEVHKVHHSIKHLEDRKH